MSFRPVDTRFGQQIINNYLATIASQQDQQRIELEKQRLEQQHEIELKQLEQQHEAQSHAFELGQGSLELQQLAQKHLLIQKQTEEALQGNAPPGGSIETPQTSTPSAESGMQPISQTLGLGVNQQRVNFSPDLNAPSAITLNPIAAAQLRGRTGALEAEPKLTAEAAKQAEIGQRELQKEFLTLQQKTLQDSADRASREAIAREETSRVLGAAKLTQIGELQRQVLNTTSNRFDTHPIVRDFNTLKLANEVSQANPSDLELLTAYAKALNPAQAAAPEWAITLPQTLPSLADRLGLKLSNITEAKKFIPTKMADQLKTEIKNRYKLQESAYKNFRSSEAGKLKQIGIDNPEQFLTDYNKDIKPSGPQVGDVVSVGGGKKVKITKIHPDGTFDGDPQ